MRYSLLGPLEVRRGEREALVAVGRPFARRLLIDLVVNRGTTVSIDQLVEDLWGWEPPASSRHAIQAAVSRLRSALGPDEIETINCGYRMASPRVDLDEATALAAEARALLASAPESAIPVLYECLDLWRGEPLFDVAYADWAQPVIRRLYEVRVGALIDLAAARVAVGRCTEVVGDLEALVVRHPGIERAWALLVVALCRDGRRGDAIQTLREAARQLEDNWGLSPSEELLQLEELIAKGDDALHGPWIESILAED